eukprot:TRINITY_DN3651_c0_g1_i1.p1 TRINITY_DN3651_c0_g1~~TRINITY_DN3651_c0_g1_i1.p1  ORF type:complete len:141 (+),score=28.49 TRINITY_DN3651_c0_g1_i1:81-503(+)
MISCCTAGGADLAAHDHVQMETPTVMPVEWSPVGPGEQPNSVGRWTLPSESTTIDVELEPGKIGMKADRSICILEISSDGSLKKYNDSAREKAKIAVGDTLVLVETPTGKVIEPSKLVEAMSSEVAAGRPLKLKFKKAPR